MAFYDFIYSKTPCCMMPPIKFTLKTVCWLEKLFENFQEDCLVHDHLSYLSRRIEGFMSLFLPTHPNQFLLMKTYGLEEYAV